MTKGIHWPFVSILMPVRNETAFIEHSLGAVLAQDYPHEHMEVLVADGMSTDGTRELIQALTIRSDMPVTLVDNPGHIAPTGLNAALARANGDIIIRVDGHCVISPDYVSRCVDCLGKHGVEGVGGPIDTIGASYLSNVIALAMGSTFGVGGSAFRTVKGSEMFVDTLAFPAYTREALQLAGLFDEELVRNQDDEYNYRLRKLGGRLLLSPQIRSKYYSRGTLRSLWRQYFQYGFWKVRVLQKHPQQMQPRQFAPPAFVASLIGLALLAAISKVGSRLLVLNVCTYLTVDICAALLVARTQGWRYLPVLPVTFAILHLSYGLGFLSGLVAFRSRWGDKRTRSAYLPHRTESARP